MTIDNVLTAREYKALSYKDKKAYCKDYQTLLNEYRVRVIYAIDFTPHKECYYLNIVTMLLNNAPLSVI